MPRPACWRISSGGPEGSGLSGGCRGVRPRSAGSASWPCIPAPRDEDRGRNARKKRACVPSWWKRGSVWTSLPSRSWRALPARNSKEPLFVPSDGWHGARSDAVLWRLCRRGFPGFFSWQPDAVPRESSSGEQPEWLAASKEASLEENARPGPAADFGVLACMW
jgi:hypothetical protein